MKAAFRGLCAAQINLCNLCGALREKITLRMCLYFKFQAKRENNNVCHLLCSVEAWSPWSHDISLCINSMVLGSNTHCMTSFCFIQSCKKPRSFVPSPVCRAQLEKICVSTSVPVSQGKSELPFDPTWLLFLLTQFPFWLMSAYVCEKACYLTCVCLCALSPALYVFFWCRCIPTVWQ